MNKTELVLLYHFTDTERTDKIKAALMRMKIAVKEVPDSMVGQKIGYLLGLKGFGENKTTAEESSFDEEVMVLQNVSRKRLDALLVEFREAGIEKVNYKAVVTPYNLFWSLRRLCETIKKEHHMMLRDHK